MEDERDERRGLTRQDSALRPARAGGEPTVPVAYAEKTMSSLLRLHEDLVEEKERRIDLYRQLMDREQELAELRAYVRLLEGEKARDEKEREKEAAAAPLPVEDINIEDLAEPGEAQEREASERGTPGQGPTLAWLPSNLRRSK